MKTSTLIKTALMAAAIPLMAGCVVYSEPPPGQVVVDSPPPAQVEVVPVCPYPGWIWVGGSWEWRGRWVWAPGRWAAAPHPGAVWVHGYWGNHGHRRVWVGAHWN